MAASWAPGSIDSTPRGLGAPNSLATHQPQNVTVVATKHWQVVGSQAPKAHRDGAWRRPDSQPEEPGLSPVGYGEPSGSAGCAGMCLQPEDSGSPEDGAG